MSSLSSSRYRTEQDLLCDRTGFSGAFLSVQYLRHHIDTQPGDMTDQTIDALLYLIRSRKFEQKKQAFFLFSEAADALVALALHLELPEGMAIISALQDILVTSAGHRVRAVGDAMGRLPVRFPYPLLPLPEPDGPLPLSLDRLFAAMQAAGTPRWQGRSLILPLADHRLGVIKFARSADNVRELFQEIFWQRQLFRLNPVAGHDLPQPLIIDGTPLFELTADPPGAPQGLYQNTCIAFTTGPAYFDYPNEPDTPLSWAQTTEIFSTTAQTLGELTASGIFHTALIPLFHNRVQQGRRADDGLYLWEHGGRLDQWLESCRFPNFGASGLRDFEHLIQESSSQKLRHYIGEHILSFILVMGSCFRIRDPRRRGWDSQGRPADTRDLFDERLFIDLLTRVCQGYFRAFSPKPLPEPLENRIPKLVHELINAMGQDHHMEEILRIQDQQNMDQESFARFLSDRGIHPAPAKGEADIVIMTGPHLGGFNRPISVAGLVDFLYNFSSLCVSYCFARGNRLKAQVN